MSWGQAQVAAPPAPVQTIAICEAPNCKNPATVVIDYVGQERSSCAHCADSIAIPILRTIEGAPFDEKTRDLLLSRWNAAKVTLEAAKNSEMEVRKLVAAYVFPTPKEGVNNHELGGGYVLKMGHKLNYRFGAPLEAIEAVEDKCIAIGNEGRFLVERIIVWKADFSKSEYNKLDTSLAAHKAVKDLVDTILEITPGSPTLEIKEPKAKLNG